MKKTFSAFLAVATVAGALAATPASAQRGVAAGVAAGLIGGAIVGGAIASSRPGYAAPAPVYVEEAEPGDTLEIRIQKIELAIPYAYNGFGPNRGFLPEDFC